MRYILSILLVTQLISAREWSFNLPYYLILGGTDANLDQPFRHFVTRHGYPLEVHTDIQTEDGYLLTMFRIPYGIKQNNSHVSNKPVVLLLHGLLCSSEDWVVLGPEKSLAFILADRGYDVWLGNSRGSMHSRKHIKYDPIWNGEYWKFSYHELGYYDLATMTNYALSITKQEQLYYFGHSQGATSFFVLTSMRPEFNKLYKFMVGLAPGILLPHSKNFLLRALSKSYAFDNLILKLGVNEVPHLRLYTYFAKTICTLKGIPQLICTKLHFLNLGGVSDHFDQTMIADVMLYQYAGAGLRQAIHYAQGIRSGSFRQYDHGEKENLKIYDSKVPPEYNLTNVVTGVAYFYAVSDKLVSVEDQQRSVKLLPNAKIYKVPDDQITHLEMLVARDIAELAYEKAINLMEQS